MLKSALLVLFSAVVLSVISCRQPGREGDDCSLKPVPLTVMRFEQDLFRLPQIRVEDVRLLKKKYGTFFDLFCKRMIRIPASSDSLTAHQLNAFVRDSDVQSIFRMADSLYALESRFVPELEKAFSCYKYYFPDQQVPLVVTYLSAFNYQVIATDSVLGIGLDMFLGADRESMYGSVGFPMYMSRKFSPSYLPITAMKGWIQSEYDPDSVKNELLSQIIYQGKNLYTMKLLFPELSDTIITGFTGSQLKWCEENESNIWGFFIEKNLLFSTVQQEYFKFISDGPTTNGFPQDSPGNIGSWTGYRIVSAYMKNNSAISLGELMKEKDAQHILQASGYKPRR